MPGGVKGRHWKMYRAADAKEDAVTLVMPECEG